VDAAEIWHFYAGAPLELSTSSSPGEVTRRTLGAALGEGELPQLIVAPDEWQSARTLGEFTLVGCTVSPAFEFENFELAPPDFEP
jgi:predicted cupin superfamily sugar epimerase